MTSLDIEDIRNVLLDRERFSAMANAFIRRAIEDDESEDEGWKDYFKLLMEAIACEYIDKVFLCSESPIERKFLNSLLLYFLKNDGLGLVMHPTYGDARKEISEFRTTISKFREFWSWFKINRPTPSIEEFLEKEITRGALSIHELPLMRALILKYGYIPLLDSYHLTLQPKFVGILVDGRSIRPDMYFWIPSRPDINVVVECDGFQFHSDQKSFVRDRKKDRQLKLNGYDTLRFSGSEVFRDPVHTSIEIVEYLGVCKCRGKLKERFK